LGEFSPIGRLFSLGSFLLYKEPNFTAYLLHGKSNEFLTKKPAWATFWAIISHLVAPGHPGATVS
jgi:hypothetical protein